MILPQEINRDYSHLDKLVTQAHTTGSSFEKSVIDDELATDRNERVFVANGRRFGQCSSTDAAKGRSDRFVRPLDITFHGSIQLPAIFFTLPIQ